jgi:trehalose/maltose hydrolase-like predicted phosphorylase
MVYWLYVRTTSESFDGISVWPQTYYWKDKTGWIWTKKWKKVADNMYFPVSKDLGIYLQQDGF